ncbi:MAG TPA: hypothetical protein EYN66_15760 [Myxococcales bacterium]|nr:hypothetical protein [Myxococcales bacterium]
MPLFPDIPLPLSGGGSFAVGTNGAAPGLQPPGLTSGVIPGLDNAVPDLLRNYNPGEVGIAHMASNIQIVLPYPEWAWWSKLIKGTTGTIPAASAVLVEMFTVPADRRFWLDSCWMNILSGDNNINQFSIEFPSGYYETSGYDQIVMANLSSVGDNLMWPDVRGQQTMTNWAPGPVLCEPGTRLLVKPSGDGAGTSAIGFNILGRLTKLVRERTP